MIIAFNSPDITNTAMNDIKKSNRYSLVNKSLNMFFLLIFNYILIKINNNFYEKVQYII